MRFYDTKHENIFYDLIKRMNNTDCYHSAVAYLIGLDTVCREHIESLYDFDEACIKPSALSEAWQTGTSRKTTRLMFNLWNGYCSDGETYTDADGYESDLPSRMYAVDEIFCCGYAPYFYEAIKLRYPEYASED
jgi:hypothetical protein